MSAADIRFVCAADDYAVFASTLWEVARSGSAELDGTDPPVPDVESSAGDGWAQWAADPDWQVI